MSQEPIKIVQITDCHLGEELGLELLSMDPDESLDDVLSLINENHTNNDLLIATGDLANESTLPAYQRLYKKLSDSLSYPFAWLPGNHDDPEIMATLGDTVNEKLYHLGDWLIVLLDSRREGCIYGHLDDSELAFLDETLTQYPNKHIMVCFHHQPVPIGSQWMDNYIIRNAASFWDVVEGHNNIKVVLWGHIHQEFADNYQQIALLATPSTCIQFTPGKKDFHVEDAMPGYRWFELNSDGSFTTGVERVTHKDYGTDYHSHGY